MDEIAILSQVLKDVTRCDKLNIAAIGNIVPQLHVHIVARRRDDAVWPRPVWGAAPARIYGPAERERLIAAIRAEVAFG
jgi:diadenosine tetraphosphate (Ap4A) HIT family hydrolase